jgi:type IV pilus assembly protein PilC
MLGGRTEERWGDERREEDAPGARILGPSLAERARFFRRLATLLHSGISVAAALEQMEDTVGPGLAYPTRTLRDTALRGGLLSDVMKRYANAFPLWMVAVFRGGELTGDLAAAARDLADWQEEELALRSAINNAVFYLRIVLFVFLYVLLLLVFVQPLTVMANVFTMNAPPLADIPAALGATTVAYLLFVIVPYTLLSYLFHRGERTASGARRITALAARIPLSGAPLRTFTQLRFARVLGGLWRAGVTPLTALQAAADAAADPRLSRLVAAAQGDLGRGASAVALIKRANFLPFEAGYLLGTAEIAGNVGQALAKVESYSTQKLQQQITRLPTIASLLLTFVMTPACGVLIIYFYGGYFSLILRMLGQAGGGE